ncbi:Panacea domain-containing protein [Xanthomonas axonopodis]|uniref:Panacea domain-containing protein n=1 Tax=Xanthomonas axonopodis TaxID=53413 RepID=UPI0035582FC8
MASVLDVAKYVLEQAGEMSTMKLQKLVYYSQAWSLVWDGDVMFDDPIQAWANGPVSPRLFAAHRGMYRVSASDIDGDSGALTKDQRETVQAVLSTYGDKSPAWLSELTHKEDPWRDARKGVPDGAQCQQPITPEAMLNYYDGL